MTSLAIEIFVNGDRFHVPAEGSISGLLAHLKIPSDRVAVEVNKELIRKRDWDATTVENGARIEVVEFVGGG